MRTTKEDDRDSSRWRRLGVFLLVGILAALLVLLAAACGGGAQQEPAEPSAAEEAASKGTTPDLPPEALATLTGTAVTLYSSPTCGCCREYAAYLEELGFQVETEWMEDLTPVKDDLGIPEEMRSCHTAIIGEYFVEGHVPVEAVWKLLDERPTIDGIALPGMPSGSPGMSGGQEEPFVIYSISDGGVEEFVTMP